MSNLHRVEKHRVEKHRVEKHRVEKHRVEKHRVEKQSLSLSYLFCIPATSQVGRGRNILSRNTSSCVLVIACLVMGFCFTACEKETWKPKEADRRQIVVQGAKMTLHTGVVGTGKYEKQSTYVLVEATNTSDLDLSVTLGGDFLDSGNQRVGKMIRQSLRIPAQGTRTFALVEEKRKPLPNATGATIEVTSAVQLDYVEQIVISDLHEYKDGNRIVVKAYVQNTVGRIGKALVFATFYDAEGKPIQRPSTLFRLERHAKRGVQFVGPQGSVRATMSIGDIVY